MQGDGESQGVGDPAGGGGDGGSGDGVPGTGRPGHLTYWAVKGGAATGQAPGVGQPTPAPDPPGNGVEGAGRSWGTGSRVTGGGRACRRVEEGDPPPADNHRSTD